MSASHAGHRFIFVGGPPRSGTTLVQNMLDSHPDICGGPEFLHLPDIVNVRAQLHSSIEKGWIDQFCSADDVDRLTREYINGLLLPLADTFDAPLLSEKTPANVLVFRDLIELFPEAQFVFVVRDPRAIVASLLKVGRRGVREGWNMQDYTQSVRAAIEFVRRCLDAGFAAATSAPDRVLVVVYERLVTDPEAETQRLCDFLQIAWAEQMLHPGKQRHPGEGAITNNVWYDGETYARDPVTSEIDKWKQELSPREQVKTTLAFRDNADLARLDYTLSVDALSPFVRTVVYPWNAVLRLGARMVGKAGAAGNRVQNLVRRKVSTLKSVE